MRQMTYGDKIYARLSINGQNLTEFVIDRISNMSELIAVVRNITNKAKGLAKLYVRNISRGWSIERPLMLYPDKFENCSGRLFSNSRKASSNEEFYWI